MHFPNVFVDTYCVMPNHLHGILLFNDSRRGTTCRAPTFESEASRHAIGAETVSKHEKTERFAFPVAGSLPTVIRSFKAAVTKHTRRVAKNGVLQVWQRGYYERVIRNERELELAREYIANNPLRWELDAENPAVIAKRKQGSWQKEPK